jgi:hypothetical protein
MPDWAAAMDRMGSLSPQQWENLAAIAQLQKQEVDRLIKSAQKVPLKDRLHDKVQSVTGRVHAVYLQQTKRLSDMATRLQSQAGEQLQAGREWVGQQAQAGREWGAQQVQAGREWGAQQVQAGREWGAQQVQAGREWGSQQIDRATEFGQRAAGAVQAGTEAVGQWAGQQRDRAVEAGRSARDSVSRWFQTQKTRVSIASEGARATIAAMKFDPNMPQNTSAKDLAELSQQYSKVMSAPNLEARMEALQGLMANTQAQMDAQTAARALGGVAPASQAVGQAQATQTQSTEEAAKVSLQKSDTKGIGKG